MKKQYHNPEADMCARLAEVLSKDGWDMRHSVRFNGFELDLCGLRENERGEVVTLAIEAKQSLTLELWSKALFWRWWASYVAVLVPTVKQEAAHATAMLHKASGVGVYTAGLFVRTAHEPINTGTIQFDTLQLADAARKSSSGILIQGGSRAPREATTITQLAERVFAYMREQGFIQQGLTTCVVSSLSEAIPEATPAERKEVARTINDNWNCGYWCRKMGKDFLVYPR